MESFFYNVKQLLSVPTLITVMNLLNLLPKNDSEHRQTYISNDT